MPFPFEVPFEEVKENLDAFVDEVFGALQSEFLTLPKGEGFIDYPVFERGYEALKRSTQTFRDLSHASVIATVYETPIAFIVLRTMLGFTPPEWAYLTSQRSGTEVTQGAVRALDRRMRMAPLKPLRAGSGVTDARLRALVTTACELLEKGAPPEVTFVINRVVYG